jgi:hypothetical protein
VNLVRAEELKTRTIISNGIGKDVQSAAQNAAQNALTNVVGSFVDATTVFEKRKEIKNGISEETKKIKTDIKEYSQGSIRSFEIIDKSNEDGFVKITAKVVVNIEDFRVYIKKYASDEKEIDQGLFAVIETEQKQQQNISKIMNDITRPFYTGEVLELTLGELKSVKNADPKLRDLLQKENPDMLNDPAAVYLNIKLNINEDFKNKFLKTIENVAKIKKEILYPVVMSGNQSSNDKNTRSLFNEIEEKKYKNKNITNIFIRNNGKLSLYEFEFIMNYNNLYDYKSDGFIGCGHEFSGNFEAFNKVAKNLILEFIGNEMELLGIINYAGRYNRFANKNPNAYIVYDFWGNTQSASGQTPWIPVKCIVENSYPRYPAINLDNRELNLFFFINENMKKAKKIKLRLEN